MKNQWEKEAGKGPNFFEKRIAKTIYNRGALAATISLKVTRTFGLGARGCIFSHVQPFYEQAVSALDP